jgi:hypothetical protein
MLTMGRKSMNSLHEASTDVPVRVRRTSPACPAVCNAIIRVVDVCLTNSRARRNAPMRTFPERETKRASRDVIGSYGRELRLITPSFRGDSSGATSCRPRGAFVCAFAHTPLIAICETRGPTVRRRRLASRIPRDRCRRRRRAHRTRDRERALLPDGSPAPRGSRSRRWRETA